MPSGDGTRLGPVLVIDLEQPLFLCSIGTNFHVEEVGLGAVDDADAADGGRPSSLALCQLELHHEFH